MDNKTLSARLAYVVEKWQKQGAALIEALEEQDKKIRSLEKKIKTAEQPDEAQGILARAFTSVVRLPFLKRQLSSQFMEREVSVKALTKLADDLGGVAVEAIARNRPLLHGQNHDSHKAAIVEAWQKHGEDSIELKQARALMAEFHIYVLGTANAPHETKKILREISGHMTRPPRSVWVQPKLKDLAA